MPFRGKRSNRPKSMKPRKTFKQNKGKVVSLQTKAYVKNMISRNLEKKELTTTAVNVAIQSAAGATVPTYFNMFPNIAQGDTQGTRDGNEIIVKKAVIRGRVNMLPQNSITNSNVSPSLVKLWLCRRNRRNFDGGVPVIGDFNQFFNAGSSANGFQGNPLDMFAPVNKDYWSVLSTRSFQLGGSQAIFTSSNIASGATQVSIPFTFYFDKYLGKLMYNDATTNNPTNKELYLVFQAVYADGTSSALQSMIETHYVINYEYTDA